MLRISHTQDIFIQNKMRYKNNKCPGYHRHIKLYCYKTRYNLRTKTPRISRTLIVIRILTRYQAMVQAQSYYTGVTIKSNSLYKCEKVIVVVSYTLVLYRPKKSHIEICWGDITVLRR